MDEDRDSGRGDSSADALDLVGDAELFDDTECIELLAKLDDDKTPYRRRKEFAEAQRERLNLLQRDGYVAVIGPNGMTVIRGPAYDSRGGAA
jgi:hypothetical protein